MISASRRGTTYSLVRHHNNGQNSSDNNVMPLKPRNVNAVIAGNVADIYKGDEGMRSNQGDPNAECGHTSIVISVSHYEQSTAKSFLQPLLQPLSLDPC